MSKTYNSLIKEKSPYLLQHSTNPVNWEKWSEKILLKAKKEDKLIILSIGYSTCHWCHVMEKESFENIKIAEIMNKYFICIKVDREERPDIDSIYMDAIQSMGIQGGWPLNLFLTPNKKPFYGGTYFNKESWFKILINIIEAYKKHKDKIIKSSNNFSKDLNRTHDEKYSTKNKFSISTLINEIKIKFDYKEGGISRSPKFPMPNLWKSLLFYSLENKDKEVYSHVIMTIDKISEGGIYDQIEGGFSRYSVDEKWIIPHFEKMLYDNGQLLDLYADIFKITKNEKYLHIINNTINWLKNNMTDKSGGFYSAIDADSEGEEGKYYIWKYHEIEKILGNLTAKACKIFKITKEGNWNNHNILLRDYKQKIDSKKFNKITKKLLLERNKRIKPLIDNKIISSWNAITLIGLLNCYQATNDNKILELATKNAKFIKDKLITKSTITRVYKNKIGGFLDDYAYVIKSFIKYFETTQNFTYLNKARELIEETIKNFYCPKNKLFYYTSNTSEKLISRKIEIFDSVIPSSNSIMYYNLLFLGKIYDDTLYLNIYNNMNFKLEKYLNNYEFMSNWIHVNNLNKSQINEIIVNDPSNKKSIIDKINSKYIPNKILIHNKGNYDLDILNSQKINNKLSISLCRNKVCQLPLKKISELFKTIKYPILG